MLELEKRGLGLLQATTICVGTIMKTTGVNRTTINQTVPRAEGAKEAVRDAIMGADLDKGVVLDELYHVGLRDIITAE